MVKLHMCVLFCFIFIIVCDLNLSNKNTKYNLEVFKTFEFDGRIFKVSGLITVCYVMAFRLCKKLKSRF